VVYNGVGIKRHGFIGYLKHTCIIDAAPWWLRYTILVVIEFVSNIIVRPITLTVRLSANFIAGHFLLAIVFAGTYFFVTNGVATWPLAAVTFPLAVVLVGFEVFVAILQAFIFSILSASYIGQALAEEH
jgi:F-type H+-transporting ATPase subunit a